MEINRAINVLKKYCEDKYNDGCHDCGIKNNCCESPCYWKKPKYCYMENENNAIEILKNTFENIDDCVNCPFYQNCGEIPKHWKKL